MVGMKPVTEDDITNSLVNMSPDQRRVMSFPGLHETLWNEREFLGWRDAHHPRRGYLVFWVGEAPRGIMVTSAHTAMPAGKAAMCALCHTQQPAPQVSLFTAPKAGDEGARGNTVGTYLCADLSCSAIIRMLPALPGAIMDPHEALRSKGDSIRQRLENFSNRVLSRDVA